MKKRFVWLISENLSKTHNNNSWYFFEQVCLKDDEIDKYFILESTKQNRKFVRALQKEIRDKIVWRNSLKHHKLFLRADMFFVTLSYRDILPEELCGRKLTRRVHKPLVYLQHGTLKMKKIGYSGHSFWDNLYKFVYYNQNIKERVIEENGFSDYQLYNGKFMPRWKELARRYEKLPDDERRGQILFFVTWREYFGDNVQTENLVYNLLSFISNTKLRKFLEDTNRTITICWHPFFNRLPCQKLYDAVRNNNRIKIVSSGEVDVMDLVAKSELLITDYSSIAFDFTFLKKPVILYQPDIDFYLKGRNLYCSQDEMYSVSAHSVTELIDLLTRAKYELNDFFKSDLLDVMNYDEIIAGRYIDEMYNYFREQQLNKIVILGYNFSGRGGTVTAVKAQAEALREQGYLVELLSLKVNRCRCVVPNGVTAYTLYDPKQNKWKNLLKRHAPLGRKSYYWLEHDCCKQFMYPYTGWALRRYLQNSNARMLISSRETIHPFVDKFAPNDIVKLYFYHGIVAHLEGLFPGLPAILRSLNLGLAAFVTENAKTAWDESGLIKYEDYCISGNSLCSEELSSHAEIARVHQKFAGKRHQSRTIDCFVLTRLSADRYDTIMNLIAYGNTIKGTNIILNVYGSGELTKFFKDMIAVSGLGENVKYHGSTANPKKQYHQYDCLVDFSEEQTFGMTYIEAILNGMPVLARHNDGSDEVLADFPGLFYDNYDELTLKLRTIKNMSLSKKIRMHDMLYEKYSRTKIANEILKFMPAKELK